MRPFFLLAPLAGALVALPAGAQRAATAPAVAAPAADAFVIDAAHSSVTFKVRHLGISTVTGRFARFGGSFTYDSTSPSLANVAVTIDAASVDTDIQRRDDDLRSDNFFDVARYPTLAYVARRIDRVGDGKYRVLGDLTIHGVTKPAVLDAELGGVLHLANGTDVAAVHATTTINRFDYGLTWNRLTEGVANVAPEVQIILDVEARRGKRP